MAEDNSKMIPITGLWVTTTKSGQKMLSGNLTRSSRFVILINKKKDSSKDEDKQKPDYYLFLAHVDPKPNNSDTGI